MGSDANAAGIPLPKKKKKKKKNIKKIKQKIEKVFLRNYEEFSAFQQIKLSTFEKVFLLFSASFWVRIEILSFEKFKKYSQF